MMTDPTAPAVRWVDHERVAERAEFRGPEGEHILSFLHLPATTPRGAVVICSPLLGEFMRNYRREVLLARKLAQQGFAVERFQYRFTGNSDGDEEHLSFESMREDALGSIEHIRSEAPEGPLFLVGTRWGALIAAAAAAARPDAGLVLWEPLLDASRFFREAFRSRLVKAVRDGVEEPTTGKELEDRLRAGETVEVPAHRIHPAFYVSSVDRALGGELGTGPRDVLAIQVGPTGSVRPDLARQAETWRAAGLRIDLAAVRGEESWWLGEDRVHDGGKGSITGELISLTRRWLEDRAPHGGDA